MLKFEYVQDGEYKDPYYQIEIEEVIAGGIEYFNGEWGLDWIYGLLTSETLDKISEKIKQLNKSTRSQRILGVF